MGRVTLLGIEVDPLTIAELNDVVRDAVAQGARRIVAHHNAHSVYLFNRDAKVRAFYARAYCIHVDGMALVFLGRLLGRPLGREHRVTYVDWVGPLMTLANRSGHRVFYLGSAPAVAERDAARLRREHPGLEIATHHGYFHDAAGEGSASVLQQIREFRPDILLVGMGMPRQEHWVFDHLDNIDARVILTAGACMDYVAGAVPTPPRWMGRWGLEWLYRLAGDPRRLWRRYLVEPWFVLRLFLRDLVTRR